MYTRARAQAKEDAEREKERERENERQRAAAAAAKAQLIAQVCKFVFVMCVVLFIFSRMNVTEAWLRQSPA